MYIYMYKYDKFTNWIKENNNNYDNSTNNNKVFKTYGWRPTANLDKTLKDIYSWLINNDMKDYFKWK